MHYDNLAKVPYATQGTNWISYDDADSFAAKIEYSLQYNISGFMVWSIETDDFHGTCGENYPLLKSINKALGKPEITSYSLTPPTTAATTTSVSTSIKKSKKL